MKKPVIFSVYMDNDLYNRLLIAVAQAKLNNAKKHIKRPVTRSSVMCDCVRSCIEKHEKRQGN